jgi:hypothetical protein
VADPPASRGLPVEEQAADRKMTRGNEEGIKRIG